MSLKSHECDLFLARKQSLKTSTTILNFEGYPQYQHTIQVEVHSPSLDCVRGHLHVHIQPESLSAWTVQALGVWSVWMMSHWCPSSTNKHTLSFDMHRQRPWCLIDPDEHGDDGSSLYTVHIDVISQIRVWDCKMKKQVWGRKCKRKIKAN